MNQSLNGGKMRGIWNGEFIYTIGVWIGMIWVLRRYFTKGSLLGNILKGTKLEKNDDCKEFIE